MAKPNFDFYNRPDEHMIKSHCISGALCVTLISALSGRPGVAAEIKVLPSADKPATILLTGKLLNGDADKFQSLLKQMAGHGRVNVVLGLNSPGGLADEGLKIASAVNGIGIATWVAEGAVCASSCFIIFAAGTQKFAQKGARIGTHSAREFGDSMEISPWATRLQARVLQFYRVPAPIIEKTLTTAPDGMSWLSKDDLHSMGVTILAAGATPPSTGAATSGGVNSNADRTTRPWVTLHPLTPPAAGEPQSINSVAHRTILYEENPMPQGARMVGTVNWQTQSVAPEPGETPEIAVRAVIEIPERHISTILLIRRETDKSSLVSHILEISFNLPADFPFGGIAKVPGALMKEAEQTRGTPLAGWSFNPSSGFFLVALSLEEAHRNLQLIRERAWLSVPIVYSNGGRAILAIEKGVMGQRAIDEALANWGEPTSPSHLPAAAGPYEVKVASQRSQASVEGVYRTLQQKYPNVLGNRHAIIRRVNLADRGIYYRALVGPFITKDEASQFCTTLRAAGGGCLVQMH
jgi:hypothetical protein